MLFAFLFGLSMDYEVFILSRMREEYDRTGSTEQAVIQGSAAQAVWSERRPDPVPRLHGDGLGAGNGPEDAGDRPGGRDPARRDRDPALIVPAVITLMGRWNWVLPPGPAKLLWVKPSDSAPSGGGRSRVARRGPGVTPGARSPRDSAGLADRALQLGLGHPRAALDAQLLGAP